MEKDSKLRITKDSILSMETLKSLAEEGSSVQMWFDERDKFLYDLENPIMAQIALRILLHFEEIYGRSLTGDELDKTNEFLIEHLRGFLYLTDIEEEVKLYKKNESKLNEDEKEVGKKD